MSARAKLFPQDGYQVDGKQKKLGLDGMTVFCDGIRKVVRNGINDESSNEKKPATGTPGENKEQAEPSKQ